MYEPLCIMHIRLQRIQANLHTTYVCILKIRREEFEGIRANLLYNIRLDIVVSGVRPECEAEGNEEKKVTKVKVSFPIL